MNHKPVNWKPRISRQKLRAPRRTISIGYLHRFLSKTGISATDLFKVLKEKVNRHRNNIEDPRCELSSIPSDWVQAASFFADLRYELPLDDDEWDALIEWLRESEFDARSILAGEVAAGLIRDHAPMRVKDDFLAEKPSDDWQKHFQKIVVSQFRPLTEIDRDIENLKQQDSIRYVNRSYQERLQITKELFKLENLLCDVLSEACSDPHEKQYLLESL